MPISRLAWLLGTAGAAALGAIALSLPGGGPQAYLGGVAPETNFAPFGATFTQDELRAELGWLVATMREVGARPFAFSSEGGFEAAYAQTLARLDKPSSAGVFYLEAARLFSNLNDGHASILLGREFDLFREDRAGRSFPLSLKFGEYGIFVDQPTVDAFPSGTKIVAIDGVLAETFTRQISDLQGAQTKPVRLALVNDRQLRQMLYATRGEVDAFLVEAVRPDGERVVERIAATTADQMRAALSGAGRQDGANYTFSRIASDRVAYIDYRSCQDKAAFEAFLKRTFASIKERPVAGVVIDIRANGGGDSDVNDVLWPFVSGKSFSPGGHFTQKVSARIKREYGFWKYNAMYIPPAWLAPDRTLLDMDFTRFTMIHPGPNALRFDGPVYLLSGLHTFSSALACAQEAKDYGLATIVGQETSPVSHTGQVYTGYSPRIGVQFSFTTKYFGEPNYGPMQGVTPDVTVVPTEADLRAHRDPVLDHAVKAILERKNA
jgi:C-terminal processing protease CtpA/Prc